MRLFALHSSPAVVFAALALLAALPTGPTAPPRYSFSQFETFAGQPNLWELRRDQFPKNTFFNWVSDRQDCTRWPAYSNSPAITFLGMKCYEVLLRFGQERIEQIELYLYSRGDAGEIRDPKVFAAKVAEIQRIITGWAGGQPGSPLPDEKLVRGMVTKGQRWVRENRTNVTLHWSISEKIKAPTPDGSIERIPFRAEFILLTLTPAAGAVLINPPKQPDSSGSASKQEAKRRVQRDADGFTFIDGIPMVDQGQKGYCVVATAERIIRYYGVELSQHDFAQLASSLPRGTGQGGMGGTYMNQFELMFDKIDNKIKIKCERLAEIGLDTLIDQYNRQAKREGRPGIGLVVGRDGFTDMERTFGKADLAILKTGRCEFDKKGYREFVKNIKRKIDLGAPLAWSVVLGIVPENPPLPQLFGGHARLIFGYNATNNELLYSDSWGAKHTRKVMKMDDAWAITTGLMAFESKHRN